MAPGTGLRDAGHGLANLVPGALATIVAPMPLSLAAALGGGTGACISVLPHRMRRRALANLAAAYPGSSLGQRQALTSRMFTHAGREAGATVRWFARDDARTALPATCGNFAELAAAIRSDLEGGRGAIYVGAHFGNPQLLSALCATVAPVTGIGTDYHARSHLAFVVRGRERLGLRYIPENSPPLELLRALQRNELVTFLPDMQPRRNGGAWLPFFGRPACTTRFPAALARLTGCVLRPVFLVREGKGYRALVRDRLVAPPVAEGDAGLDRTMLRWTALLEEEVRRRPEQWIWMSRRWRPMPEGARPVALPEASRA